MKVKQKEINYQFKILIALAMIFVVAGHVGNPTFSFNGFFNYDYFHMPLFMFISGYFFNLNRTIKDEIYLQIRKLLLPLIGWNIIYGLLVTYLRHSSIFNFTIGNDLSFYSLFIRSFVIGDSFGLNIPSWFLFSLFLVKLFYIFLRKCILKIYSNLFSETIVVVVLLFIGILGVWLGQSNIDYNYKVQVSRVMYLTFWYSMGLYYKVSFEKYDNFSNVIYFTFVLSLQLILILFIKGSNVTIVYAAQFNISAICTILLAFTGIAFWLRISRLLTPYLKDNLVIRYISDNTFGIMMHHGLLLKIFIGLIFIITSYLGMDFYQGFNYKLYAAEPWYNPLPWGNYFFTHVYLFVGLFFSCVFSVWYKIFKKNLIKVYFYVCNSKFNLP